MKAIQICFEKNVHTALKKSDLYHMKKSYYIYTLDYFSLVM